MPNSNGFGECIEDYEVLGLLGKGGFATVYRARSKQNNELVAIKMIDKNLIQSAGLTNRVRQEVEIHSRLKHPFVVELFTFFQDSEYVYLVMELANNGELQRYMKEHMGRPMAENEVAAILHQVVSGILYLHSYRIMHRDISLSNLLLSKNMDVKIADFGLATQLKQSDEKHLTMCGTPNFISPEVASRASHGLPADVWAIGCLLYTLLVGRPPFDTHAIQATLTKVVMSDYSLPNMLSFEAKDLINKLLKKDPKERIPLQDIVKHPFMCRYPKPAAAGTVAINNIQTSSNLTEISNTTTALMQSTAYTNSSGSCDSGIMTFASSSTSNSLRPATFNTGGGHMLEKAAMEPNYEIGNNDAILNKNYYGNRDVDNIWLPQKIPEQKPGQWSIQYNKPTQQQQNNRYDEISIKSAPTQQFSHQKYETDMIAGIPTATSKVSSHHTNSSGDAKCVDQRLSVPPLNTERLQPTRFRNRNAIMSIQHGGEVVVEFIKFRAKVNEDRITDICWISKDGQRIVIYEPDPGRGLPILDEPPELPQHDSRVGIFSYDNLPSKHWRKYLFASRFISLVKASTPKVTFFSELAKFHLMESMLHFEVIFYDGAKVTQSPNEGLKIYDRHGRLLQPHEHANPTATALLAHQNVCLRHCEIVCNAMEAIQQQTKDSGNSISCFPIVIGRRPSRDRIGHEREKSKTSTIQLDIRDGMETIPKTQSQSHRKYQHCENDNARPIRVTTVPGIGKATELSNGIINVQFHDGTTLSVANSAMHDNQRALTYMQPSGIATHFTPHDDLPLAVREKLSHLPQIEEQLRNSMPTTNPNHFGCNEIFSTPITTKNPRLFTSTPATPIYGVHNIQQPMRYFR